jgi:hypothetical protein
MNGEGPESDVREPAGGQDAEGSLSDEAVPVCPNCMATLSSETRYCPSCGRPVGTFATTDPIQLIHSQSWGYLAQVPELRSKIGPDGSVRAVWGQKS